MSKAKQKHSRARGRGRRHVHTRLGNIKPGGLSKMDLGLSSRGRAQSRSAAAIGWGALPGGRELSGGAGAVGRAPRSGRQGAPFRALRSPRRLPPAPRSPGATPAAGRGPVTRGPAPRRPSAPRPWAAAGRVTVTKHFLGFGFCLVIVFQETATSWRRWPRKP